MLDPKKANSLPGRGFSSPHSTPARRIFQRTPRGTTGPQHPSVPRIWCSLFYQHFKCLATSIGSRDDKLLAALVSGDSEDSGSVYRCAEGNTVTQ